MRMNFARAVLAAGLLGSASTGISLGVAFAEVRRYRGEYQGLQLPGQRAVTVKAGTVITWTNQDDIPHTVVSTNQKFRSSALDTDDKFTFTFSDTEHLQLFLLPASASRRRTTCRGRGRRRYAMMQRTSLTAITLTMSENAARSIEEDCDVLRWHGCGAPVFRFRITTEPGE